MVEPEQFQRSRRAYEWGRARWAAARALLAFPIAFTLLAVHTPWASVLLLASFLFAATLVLGWWRSAAGRGAVAGMFVGLIPVAVGLGMRAMPAMSQAQCYLFCTSTSLVLGSVAGFVLGRMAAQDAKLAPYFGSAALFTAASAMTVGCIALGFGSLAGLGIGMVGVGLPAYALNTSRA